MQVPCGNPEVFIILIYVDINKADRFVHAF